MDRLWAPWRMAYVASADKNVECGLCKAYMERSRDEENLVVYRGRSAFIIMNRYPYNNGHIMVVPNRHVSEPSELSQEEALEVHELIVLSIKALKRSMEPHGFNIGVNVGRAAGAGLEHLHYHVVPRWLGDTNFMPALADVKVLPEHLSRTYKKLRSAIRELAPG